jgi:nitrite reductase (NADH) large subunit
MVAVRLSSKGYPVGEPLIIVGNGMAAARLVDELTRCALGRHAIAVIGDEPRLAYNRVLVSSVLAGETAPEDIELKPMSWWCDSPLSSTGSGIARISADVQRPASTRRSNRLATSGVGTNAKCRRHRAMSVIRGNPEDICSQ